MTSGSEDIEDQGSSADPSDPSEQADTTWRPSSFEMVGRRAWGFIGIALVTIGGYAALAALSGLVVPLIIAVVLGVLFVPLVDKLGRWVPRPIAVLIVMLGLLILALGSAGIAISGIVDQGPQISKAITAGAKSVTDWLTGQGIDVSSTGNLATGIQNLFSSLSSGASGYFASVFSGTAAFLAGAFVAAFSLYYVLANWGTYARWLGSHLGVPADLGREILHDATWSIRRYFSALTVTSLFSAVVIGFTVAVMGLPLAFTIALVTFVTSYIPYLGAFISGTFAVLIALGSGGIVEAVVVLAVILVVQSVLQPLLQNAMTAQELNLDPLVSFGSTVVGSAVAGVLGATLSAPVLSMIVQIRQSVDDYTQTETGPEPPESPQPPDPHEPPSQSEETNAVKSGSEEPTSSA